MTKLPARAAAGGVLSACLLATAALLPAVALGDANTSVSKLDEPRPIKAKIRFRDTGSALHVEGRARGLTPGDVYVSLIYDIGSTATGPDACEPTIFDGSDPNNILATMFLGAWTVDEDGRGVLSVVNTNGGVDYVPLSKIGTVSIRNTAINNGFGPHAVLVCGDVGRDDDDDDSDSDSDG